MSSAATQAVLFDLDGTLVDSFPGIANAYHHVLEELGLGDMADPDLRQFIGPPIQVALARHFGLRGARLEEGVRIFRAHYGTKGLFQFSKYEGVEEVLRRLRHDRCDLYVATSKLQSMAIKVIDHAGWSELFAIVGGASPDGSRYRKRDVIRWTMDTMPAGTRVVAIVGDRADDIAGGRELGLPGVGVTWGYGSAQELHEAGASEIVGSPEELLSVLVRLG